MKIAFNSQSKVLFADIVMCDLYLSYGPHFYRSFISSTGSSIHLRPYSNKGPNV